MCMCVWHCPFISIQKMYVLPFFCLVATSFAAGYFKCDNLTPNATVTTTTMVNIGSSKLLYGLRHILHFTAFSVTQLKLLLFCSCCCCLCSHHDSIIEHLTSTSLCMADCCWMCKWRWPYIKYIYFLPPKICNVYCNWNSYMYRAFQKGWYDF